MAPTISKNKPRSTGRGGYKESESESDALQMVKSAQELLSAHRKRRITKRKAIENEYLTHVNDLRAKMEAHFETRADKLSKLQRAQWNRLFELNSRRKTIESAIIQRMNSIERNTINMANELNAIFSGRLEDLKQMVEPCTPQKAKATTQPTQHEIGGH